MHKKSIYQHQCSEIAEIFHAAGSGRRVLIGALDFAKDKHLCLLCNGEGDQLLKPFAVHNNREGLEYLLERIETSCKRHGIERSHVIIGGEDSPSYALNLLWALHQQKGLCVVRVNAWKAKQQRENVQASTDKLDLLGVAQTLIKRDAYLMFNQTEGLSGEFYLYEALRELGRSRDALVKTQTAISNRMHNTVKVLFPGFLDNDKDNPIRAFSKTSLSLMQRSDFHVAAYLRINPRVLAKRLKSFGLSDPGEKALKLIERARRALPPAPGTILSRQQSLQAVVASYRQLESLALDLEKLQAQALAPTPAAVLTSISGIGVITAAAIGGEQGPPDRLGSIAHLSSYAGVVPGTEQTGGPDQPAKSTRVKPRCNRRLKRHLVQAVNHMGTLVGPPEFRLAYEALKVNGQHADFIMSRRLLRVSKTLMRYRTVYLPAHLRAAGMNRQALLEYLSKAWPRLRDKWRELDALDQAFAKEAPLGIWRQLIEHTYGIELPLAGNSEPQMSETPPFMLSA